MYDCRSQNIYAGAMIWLQELRFGCRIFIILFQCSFFLCFCHNKNFLSNSRSFRAAFTWDFFDSSKIWFFWALVTDPPSPRNPPISPVALLLPAGFHWRPRQNVPVWSSWDLPIRQQLYRRQYHDLQPSFPVSARPRFMHCLPWYLQIPYDRLCRQRSRIGRPSKPPTLWPALLDAILDLHRPLVRFLPLHPHSQRDPQRSRQDQHLPPQWLRGLLWARRGSHQEP